MDQNQPITTYRRDLSFLRGQLECRQREKMKTFIRHIVDLREHVIAKCGNGSEEIAGR